jgi:hypothetical protein
MHSHFSGWRYGDFGLNKSGCSYSWTSPGLPINDAGMMSLVVKLKFCQTVDPLKIVRFQSLKWVLAEYGYKLR